MQFRGLKFIESLSIQQSMKYSIDRLGRMKWNDVVRGIVKFAVFTHDVMGDNLHEIT